MNNVTAPARPLKPSMMLTAFATPATAITVSGNETVGSSTTGNFSQVGGTHTVTGDLNLGAGFNVSASFVASGGTVSAANAYVGGTSAAAGGGSNGDFLSFGGATVNIPGTLRVYPSTDVFSDNILAVGGASLAEVVWVA